MATATGKTTWGGVLIAVQTHIRLTRSFDQRSHTYQGYVLRVRSNVGGEDRDVLEGRAIETGRKSSFNPRCLELPWTSVKRWHWSCCWARCAASRGTIRRFPAPACPPDQETSS